MADPGEGTVTRPLRVLFVCTQNRLRSPTAEALFRTLPDWEVASAGTARDADTPLTRDLLEWADVAAHMEKSHRDWIRSKLRGVLPDDRLVTLGVPDDDEFMDPDLVMLLGRLVPTRLAGKAPR